jgi:hypothetical protein
MGSILLEIEYSLLGLFCEMQIVRYLYIVVDGIVWGISVSVFFMVI